MRGGEVGRAICDIADQIERELTCDADTIENLRLELGEARDRAAGAALAVADRLQGACFRMTRQRDDDWNWRPTAAQADAVLTSMQLAANEARVVAEIVREHLSDKGD